MKAREIRHNVWWMGAVDWERRLFDELIPLPDGTSYNAYLVKGSEKTALVDTADPTMSEALMKQLSNVPSLDYLIVQHVEQDHSGSVPLVLERYPEAQVIASSKAAPMMTDHLGVAQDRIQAVQDGDEISLGNRSLRFIDAPWVHWPETMLTYLPEEKLLFTCDLFGSHLATDVLFSGDGRHVCEPAKRYYAEIMMPFSNIIRGHLERIDALDVEMIAPSHGPVHDQPAWILDAYRHWVLDAPSNLALIPYTSMHGSTAMMVDHLVEALTERGVHVRTFHMSKTDLGELAIHLVDAATVVFATPTVLVGPHPSIVFAAYLTGALRPKLQNAAVIGSYGWAGQAAQSTQTLCAKLKVDWLDPVFTKGLPTAETIQALDSLADQIAERHAGLEGGEPR